MEPIFNVKQHSTFVFYKKIDERFEIQSGFHNWIHLMVKKPRYGHIWKNVLPTCPFGKNQYYDTFRISGNVDYLAFIEQVRRQT